VSRKSNWKRRGLTKPITDKDRQAEQERRQQSKKTACLPPELRELAMKYPGLI